MPKLKVVTARNGGQILPDVALRLTTDHVHCQIRAKFHWFVPVFRKGSHIRLSVKVSG